MNAAEVIKDARRWADLHRANAYQREGARRVDNLLALAEEQAATIARYDATITWETNCHSCAIVLDGAIADYERAERAESALARVRELAEQAVYVYAGDIYAALNQQEEGNEA